MALTKVSGSLISPNPQSNSIGVGTAASGTAGEIRATNQITSFYSDERLKTKISNIENALEKLSTLTGFIYTENELAKSFGFDNPDKQVALSAQEVQRVQPEAVKPAPFDIGQDENGNEYSISGENYLTVQYDRLIPLIVNAINELKAEVELIKKG